MTSDLNQTTGTAATERAGEAGAGLFSLVLAGVVWLVVHLPLATYGPIASALGWLLRMVSSRDRRLAKVNLERVLGLAPDSPEGRRMLRLMFRTNVLCALETLRAIYDRDCLEFEGFDALQGLVRRAEDAGRGHLIVTGHLGSWELVGLAGSLASERQFWALAKRSKFAAVTPLLRRMREASGLQVLWTDQRAPLRQMIAALKRGESLGFVMDQKPEGRRGPVVSFLGFPTEFVGGPATLAVRHRCSVIAVFAVRTGRCRFRLLVEELVAAGHSETDERALTERMAEVIEGAVLGVPEQWAWNYKRWYWDEIDALSSSSSSSSSESESESESEV